MKWCLNRFSTVNKGSTKYEELGTHSRDKAGMAMAGPKGQAEQQLRLLQLQRTKGPHPLFRAPLPAIHPPRHRRAFDKWTRPN